MFVHAIVFVQTSGIVQTSVFVIGNRTDIAYYNTFAVNYETIMFYSTDPRGVYFNTFYGRNLRIFVIS